MSQVNKKSGPAPAAGSARQPKSEQGAAKPAKTAQEKAEVIKDGIKQDAEAVKEKAVAEAKSFAETHKETVAESVGGIARAAKSAADELDEREQSEAARLVREVAGGLERFSDTVANNDMTELFDKAQTFARRQPAAFLGGAVLLGLALSRFAKSTAERDGGHATQTGDRPAAGRASPGAPTA